LTSSFTPVIFTHLTIFPSWEEEVVGFFYGIFPSWERGKGWVLLRRL